MRMIFNVFMTIVVLFVLAVFIFMTDSANAGPLPDPTVTPGMVNPGMTKEKLCDPNFHTTQVRPPSAYTTNLKRNQLRTTYKGNAAHAEEDHLISLELGGHPTDPKNLWPEPFDGEHNAHEKDACENKLHKMVCAGQIELAQAQQGIAKNWITFCGGLPNGKASRLVQPVP